MKLTPRETKLFLTFGLLLVLLLGGALLAAGFRSLGTRMQDNDTLALRLEALQTAVDDRNLWEARDQWLLDHIETFRSQEDAAAALLNWIDAWAEATGMELVQRKIVDNRLTEEIEEDGAPFFRNATIRVRIQGSPDRVLKWIHSLQQPKLLTGVTDVLIEAEETFQAEVSITKSYRESDSNRTSPLPSPILPPLPGSP